MATDTVTDMKGNIVKMEVDYSETCDKKIPECVEMAKVRKEINVSCDLQIVLLMVKFTVRLLVDYFFTEGVDCGCDYLQNQITGDALQSLNFVKILITSCIERP